MGGLYSFCNAVGYGPTRGAASGLAAAAKAALHLSLRQAGLTKSELAARLDCDEKVIRRLLDPRHHSKLLRIQTALAALGKPISLRLEVETA